MSLYSLRQVARATGLDLRKVRHWADHDVINYVQPRRNMERLVTRDELQRLESEVGLRIEWKKLDDSATSADSAIFVPDNAEAQS